MFLPADELASLRADLELTLTTPVTVLRPAATDNGGGRQGNVFTARPAGRWPYARIWNKQSPKDMMEAVTGGVHAGGLRSITLWYVLVAFDLDVQAIDRLQVGGKTLEVASGDGGRTDGIGQTIICREVK